MKEKLDSCNPTEVFYMSPISIVSMAHITLIILILFMGLFVNIAIMTCIEISFIKSNKNNKSFMKHCYH